MRPSVIGKATGHLRVSSRSCVRRLAGTRAPHVNALASEGSTSLRTAVEGAATQPELGCRTDFDDVYDVHGLVGAGAFGKVYLGVHKQSGVEVAVKTMPKVRQKLTRDVTLDKISREIGLLQSVSMQPGVARFLDCFEDPERVLLITELCRGVDLKKHVDAQGPLDEDQLAAVAYEVLTMVQGCHDVGIQYADVKPANFCFTDAAGFCTELPKPRYIKAVDFGCSQRIGCKQRLTRRTGTFAFMAPEVFMKDFGAKADVWSTGVMLYWLFAQRTPYWGNTDVPQITSIQDIHDAVSTAPIRYDYGPWLHMSAEGLDFMRACLTRPEADRLGVEEALQHPWLAKYGRLYEGRPALAHASNEA